MSQKFGTEEDQESARRSAAFLKEAARHFVCMSYWAVERGKAPKQCFASCFVIESESAWFLVTAGHVVRGIRDAVKAGIDHHTFSLNDQLARTDGQKGRAFNLPYYFEETDWIIIEEDPVGTDYAAAILRPFIAAGLAAGGVKPIEEKAWGHEAHETYAPWLLLGVPAESHDVVNGVSTVKLTLLVLKPTAAPYGASTEGRTFARIVSSPGDLAKVDDIVGMSGGPIFGIRVVDQTIKYWVIGIQSSWFPTLRIVAFCEVSQFFLSIKKVLMNVIKDNGNNIRES
jgi:hypothetical protein